MIPSFAQRFLHEVNQKFPDAAEMLPKKEFKAAIHAALERMDLVTREEFDAQAAVLQRTRERLEVLEKEVAELKASGQ